MSNLRSRHGSALKGSDDDASSSPEKREHIENLVNNGPLHGFLLIFGPLLRLFAIIWTLKLLWVVSTKGSFTAGEDGDWHFLLRVAPTGCSALVCLILSSMTGTNSNDKGLPGFRDPGQAEMLIYCIGIGLKFIAMVLFWTGGEVGELSSLAKNPFDKQQLFFAITLGVVVAVAYVQIPRKLYFNKVLHHHEMKAILKKSSVEWNPYAVFAGTKPTIKFTRRIVILVRCIGFALISPIEEEVFFRSALWRYVAVALFSFDKATVITDIPLSHPHLASIVICILLFSAQYLRFKYEWIGGMILGVACHVSLLSSPASLLSPILVHSVCNICIACWVLYSKEWALW